MKAIVFSLAMSFLIMAVGTICLPRHEFPQGKGFHLSTWSSPQPYALSRTIILGKNALSQSRVRPTVHSHT